MHDLATQLDIHNGAVTAAATVFIGIFTVALAYVSWSQGRLLRRSVEVSKIAAEAAKKSADAALAVELSRVFLSEITLMSPPPLVGGDKGEPINEPAPFSYRPRFTFTNVGRTVAEVVEIMWGQRVCWELPEGLPISLGEWQPTGTVIQADGGTFTCRDTSVIVTSPRDREELTQGSSRLWVFGALTYRDFMGLLHTRRFCGAWWCPDPGDTSDRPAGFAEGGPDSYHLST